MLRNRFWLALLLTAGTGLAATAAQAGGIRKDTQGGGWDVVPNTILQQLPSGLGFPQELKIGVLGQNRVSIDKFAGPTAVTTVRAGFTIVNGAAVPDVLILTPDVAGQTFDAQGPLWWAAPAGSVACRSNPLLSYYACPSNLVSGLKIEWGSPAQEQLIFFRLGSPNRIPLYDANDFNCSPQGVDNVGQACHFDNLGNADHAWELGFNCVVAQPAAGGLPAVPGGCPFGGALEWRGILYTASADVLTAPSALNPAQGPALNEFVYSGGTLYPPPGWQSTFVTRTLLGGPKCEFVAGAPLSFQSVVFAVLLNGVPTGTATLLDGTSVLATTVLDARGIARFTTSLGSGVHSLTVTYSGDARYASSQSAADVLVSQDQYTLKAPQGC